MTDRLLNDKFLPDKRGVILHYAGTSPTVNDNNFPEGTIWIDQVGNEGFILTDKGSVPGTAQWDQFTVSIPVDVNEGGTGQTSYTDGQILIGNTVGNTLNKATLTAAAGMTVTNGNGSIDLKANFDAPPEIGDVTPAAANFTDVSMDGIAAGFADSQEQFRQAGLQTSNNVAQTLAEVMLNNNEMISIEGRVNGFRDDFSEAIVSRFFAGAYRAAGSIAMVGNPLVDIIENSAGAPVVDIDSDPGGSESIRIRVTGEAGKIINWVVSYRYHKTLTDV